MARLSFVRGLVFALIAGLGAVFWMLFWAPFGVTERAAALYALGLLPLHALCLAPTLRRGAAALLLTLVLMLPVALFRPDPLLVAVVSPFLIGIVRSVVLYPRPFARAVFLELIFNSAALLAAALFYDRGLVGTAFAIWAFWLVQAAFALAPGEARHRDTALGDPFDTAHTAAVAVLERLAPNRD